MALRALGCVAGATAAERGHKEMNFIHTKVRNKLNSDNVEKFLYARINLNLFYSKLEKKRKTMCVPAQIITDEDEANGKDSDIDEDQEPLPSMDEVWREFIKAAEEEAAEEQDEGVERTTKRTKGLAVNKSKFFRRPPVVAREAGPRNSSPEPPCVATTGRLVKVPTRLLE